MAEIRVEPVRKRGLGWLWALVLVLVLAAVAWYLWTNGYLGARAAGSAPDSTRASLDRGHTVALAPEGATLDAPADHVGRAPSFVGG